MSSPDFVRLNGEAVRVTSLTRDGDRLSLVVILRGSRAHHQFRDALTRRPLRLGIPDEPEREVTVEQAEHVASGEGERALYRHSVMLTPATDEAPTATADLTSRLDRIERKLDTLLARLDEKELS